MKITVAMFEYLDGLRESGVTNMFGAAPYLIDEFDIEKADARAVLSRWMETFDGKISAADRVAKLEAKYNG